MRCSHIIECTFNYYRCPSRRLFHTLSYRFLPQLYSRSVPVLLFFWHVAVMLPLRRSILLVEENERVLLCVLLAFGASSSSARRFLALPGLTGHLISTLAGIGGGAYIAFFAISKAAQSSSLTGCPVNTGCAQHQPLVLETLLENRRWSVFDALVLTARYRN